MATIAQKSQGRSEVEVANLLGKGSTAETNAASLTIPKGDEPSTKSGERSRSDAAAGKAMTACTLYSGCSVSMVLVNKSLASSYNDKIDGDMNLFLVIFQAATAVVLVEICKKLRWVEYPGFNLRTARLWAPVNLFFCGMLFTGMSSLQYNSVPMVTVFKNVTNIVITIGDYYYFGTRVELLVMVAFGLMLGGAIAAAWNDILITPIGLFWMVANCFSSAGYVLYLKFATKNVKLSKFGMVFYNNSLCTVFLLPVAIGMGEISTLLKTKAIHTFDFLCKNAFAGFIGFFLNFASLNCVSQTGPTTYALIGSLNKVPIALMGYILFDNEITPQTWFFICVSMCGGFLYSYAKIQAGKKKIRAMQAIKQ